jgi:hypothetical protein
VIKAQSGSSASSGQLLNPVLVQTANPIGYVGGKID